MSECSNKCHKDFITIDDIKFPEENIMKVHYFCHDCGNQWVETEHLLFKPGTGEQNGE